MAPNKIYITDEEWFFMKDTIMNTNISDYIDEVDKNFYSLIFKNGYNDKVFSKTELIFPKILNSEDRHAIHKLNKKQFLETQSEGINNNRYIIITVTKKYIEYLYDTFYKENKEGEKQMKESINKNLFDTYIKFIIKNFHDEFIEFIKNYNITDNNKF
jgi:hypothetical protein